MSDACHEDIKYAHGVYSSNRNTCVGMYVYCAKRAPPAPLQPIHESRWSRLSARASFIKPRWSWARSRIRFTWLRISIGTTYLYKDEGFRGPFAAHIVHLLLCMAKSLTHIQGYPFLHRAAGLRNRYVLKDEYIYRSAGHIYTHDSDASRFTAIFTNSILCET